MEIENQVDEIISNVIEKTNKRLPKTQKINMSKDTPLFGEDGVLDSLGLVRFIVEVEQGIQSKLGLSITLADEKAMSQKNSPFRSIGSLGDYIVLLLKEKPNGQ